MKTTLIILATLVALTSVHSSDLKEIIIQNKLENSFLIETTSLKETAQKMSALGSLQHQKGNYSTAIEYYSKSLRIREELGEINTGSYALILFLTSIAEHKTGESCKAIETIKKAINIYAEIGNIEQREVAIREGLNSYTNACNISLSYNIAE